MYRKQELNEIKPITKKKKNTKWKIPYVVHKIFTIDSLCVL